MPAVGNRNVGNSLEVLDVWGDHDIDVLCASHDTPGVDRQAADDNEFDIRFGEAPQQLVESRLAQVRRAAPVKRISL